MQFLVIGRHIDSPVAPPAQEIAMLKEKKVITYGSSIHKTMAKQ